VLRGPHWNRCWPKYINTPHKLARVQIKHTGGWGVCMEYTEIWIHWCTFFSRSWFNECTRFSEKIGSSVALYASALNRGCFEVFPGDSVGCSLAFFFHATRWICCRYLLQGHQAQEVTAAMTSGLRHRVGLVQRKLLEVPKYNGVQFWGTRICRCSASFCSSTLW